MTGKRKSLAHEQRSRSTSGDYPAFLHVGADLREAPNPCLHSLRGPLARRPGWPLAAWLVTYQVPWTPANADTRIGCPMDDARFDLSQIQLTLMDPAWQQAQIRFVQERRTIQSRP